MLDVVLKHNLKQQIWIFSDKKKDLQLKLQTSKTTKLALVYD